MILKLFGIICIFMLFMSLGNTIVLGSFIMGKHQPIVNMSKNIIYSLLPLIYCYCFQSKIYYKGEYTNTNKVDIMISNHVSTIDFCAFFSILRMYDDRNFYLIMKRDVIFVPSIGFTIAISDDIKLNRNIEEDKETIIKSINKIDNGVIIIMPEGTRFTPEKHLLAKQYSIDNNLPIFNNLLFPKMKGLWMISDILRKNNKLGRIIDISIVIENFYLKKAHVTDMLKKPLGRTFVDTRCYDIPYIDNYEMFKKWFLTEWGKKDIIVGEMLKIAPSNYIEYKPSIKSYDYMIIIIMITMLIYLTMHSNNLFLPLSFVFTYIVTCYYYYKIKNTK
jgi:1-acyl-sn-glycerol-3-phosphate acyltransferase